MALEDDDLIYVCRPYEKDTPTQGHYKLTWAMLKQALIDQLNLPFTNETQE